MKRPVLLALVLLLALAAPVAAITFGYPDGNLHPNVGAQIVDSETFGLLQGCSGTLIAPTVFLTASHCIVGWEPYGVGPEDFYVTFDSVVGPGATLFHGTPYAHPDFGQPGGDAHDVAVIVLDAPVAGITPAQLPTLGLLDAMKDAHTLKDARFVPVGYGSQRDDKTRGPQLIDFQSNERRYAEQSFLALTPYWLQLSMNPSTGSGGTCYGDSGGPHFLGDSTIVAAVTVTGDRWCRATDTTYRVDTESARAFLDDFVTLP